MSFWRRLVEKIRLEVEKRHAVSAATPDNHPEALRNPPAPLFGATLQQMSFGERAALEGLLFQLKPQVALEIGTYQGGTLRRIAPHAGHVHAFDLRNFVTDRTGLANVTFHFGDSQVELPKALAELTAAGTRVQFALVDGDHTADGVRIDLENLLASPACSRCVILAHDTMNEEVRAGIEAIDLPNRPNVVYLELDLVPGYRLATGSFGGSTWGGLGLIITGDRATDGYGEQPSQSRYVAAFDLLHRCDHREREGRDGLR
jgi:hypothetical protein